MKPRADPPERGQSRPGGGVPDRDAGLWCTGAFLRNSQPPACL
ncbi:hypothetical protein [Pseudosulfitobacter pseudonitzschiae]|nr:hypothetical protein [Pseudosulfitobacter pseudonitzschiae]